MKTKNENDERIVNTNNNTNNNTNHFDIKVALEHPKSPEKEKKPNWYMIKIVGAIIAIAVSLAIYYGKKTMDKEAGSTTPHEIHSVQPNN
ncbi:MAG: hypothetical protein ACXVDZ_17010 [Bacteroidia bacterium]